MEPDARVARGRFHRRRGARTGPDPDGPIRAVADPDDDGPGMRAAIRAEDGDQLLAEAQSIR
jgi:hypothetical protein